MRNLIRAAAWLGCFALAILSASPTLAQVPTGGLEGRFELQKRSGAPAVPQDTKIWILYGPSGGCAILGQYRTASDCHTEFAADKFMEAEFSCEIKFAKPMEQLRRQMNELKRPSNDLAQQELEQISGAMNSYYTRCGDSSIAKVMSWAEKHPTDQWQTRVALADATGHWSADGLRAGHYIVVIRATLDKIDIYSLNEAPPEVQAGKTLTVDRIEPLLSPHGANR